MTSPHSDSDLRKSAKMRGRLMDDILSDESAIPLNALDRKKEKVEENNPDANSSGDENTERGNWGHKADFILSLLGYAVGLSNVWRFPYICYRNGGGAFLIPYWIFLLCSGMPLFFLEVTIGQFTSKSAVSMWTLAPVFKGVGCATILVTVIITAYYEVIMAYVVFYFIQSFTTGELPWKGCGHRWNTGACLDYNNETLRATYIDFLGWKKSNFSGNYTMEEIEGFSEFINITVKSPAEEYFMNRALQIGGTLENMGPIVWDIFFCLIPTWIITGVCLIKGVKSSGKAVYFTATFPYVVLFALLIRGVTLPGAIDGIKFFIIPDFHKLKDPTVWCDAAFQVFFSLGPGWGGLVTMGSYNKFHNNCYKDGMMVPIIMGLTSVFAGFAVFSVAGFMAHVMGRAVGEVIDQGPQLAFVMYPEVVTKLPMAPMWSALFFFMLYTLGLDSMFVMVETAITAGWDELPQRLKIKRVYILLISCILMFLAGIPATTTAGMYLFQIVDAYTATFTVILVCICEVFAVSWIYGCERFLDDIKLMIGYRPAVLVWSLMYRFITLGVLIGIFIVSGVKYSPLKKYHNYVYPEWSRALGMVLSMSSTIIIPAWAIFEFIRAPGNTIREKIRHIFLPRPEWGPALEKHRQDWFMYQKVPPYGDSLLSRLRNCGRSYNITDPETHNMIRS